jgi:hypothetical protein
MKNRGTVLLFAIEAAGNRGTVLLFAIEAIE